MLIIFRPESTWQAIALARSPQPITRHLAPLTLLPAGVAALLTLMPGDYIPTALLSPLPADSAFGLALHEYWAHLQIPLSPAARHTSAALALFTAALAYAGIWAMILAGAVVLDLLLPLFSAPRDLRRATMVVAYSATPLLLSSVALLNTALVPVVALAAMHACYIAYLGLPVLLKVPREEAGMCVALSVIGSLIVGQVAGYSVGALRSLLSG